MNEFSFPKIKTNTMNQLVKLHIILALILLSSCSTNPNMEVELRKTFNKKIHLEMIDSLEIGEQKISYQDFRRKYRFCSIVYLQDGCGPCYPKYIEWHKETNNLKVNDDYTVLFIINANNYKVFREDAQVFGSTTEKYYHFMDPTNSFVKSNTHIPIVMLDRSILIDSENRIKLIGAPYVTEDMTKVFHSIISVTQ